MKYKHLVIFLFFYQSTQTFNVHFGPLISLLDFYDFLKSKIRQILMMSIGHKVYLEIIKLSK